MFLSALLESGVAQAWKKCKFRKVILSTDCMEHQALVHHGCCKIVGDSKRWNAISDGS